MKKYLKYVPVVLWMIMIFYFSSKPATVSEQDSRLIIQIFQFLGLDINSILGTLADFAVRKVAHFSEYFILCLLWFNLLYGRYELRKAALYSIAAVFLYACTDEFHQLFVQGRAGRFTDVLIDTSGGSLAAVIRFLSLRRKGSQYEEE